MVKRKGMGGLASELARLTSSSAPEIDLDQDDVFGDNTGAKSGAGMDDSYLKEEAGQGALRVDADMLGLSQKYPGRKVSRKELGRQRSGADFKEVEESSDDQDVGDMELSGARNTSDSAGHIMTLDDISSDEDTSGGSDEEDAEQQAQEQPQSSVFSSVGRSADDVSSFVEAEISRLAAEDASAIKVKRVSSAGEVRRAQEAVRQKRCWDRYLEVRILLQRLVGLAQKLPGPEALPMFESADKDTTDGLRSARQVVYGLAKSLSGLRKAHMKEVPAMASPAAGVETGTVRSGRKRQRSESDAGRTESITDVWEDAKGDYAACKAWWVPTIDKWHRKTQLVTPKMQKKFTVVNQGLWAMAEASMADRDRAHRKMYMTVNEVAQEGALGRGKDLQVVNGGSANSKKGGGDENSSVNDSDSDVSGSEGDDEEDPLDMEVLDDRRFYQHLLKEFMDLEGGVGGLPVRNRRGKKRKVDSRASKGRKLKFEVHPKLQNFTFPQPYPQPPMDAGELFASLFGGKKTVRPS